jgi:hypothetical protein
MNRRQKSIVINFFIVVAGTTVFVAVMLNVRDHLNKAEAMRTMEHLAEKVQEYRKRIKSTPPKTYLVGHRTDFEDVRLGNFEYRAPWIKFGAGPDTILAYARKNYQFLIGRGYIVMRLDGRVEWMKKAEFETLLKKQQTEAEIELLQKPREF